MKIKIVFAFIAGAAVGSLATWKIVEEKYKKIANEEIESVKEVYSKRHNSENNTLVEDEGPNAISDLENIEEEGGVKNMANDDPHVISPDEFGELDDYETVSMTYYADGVLEDDRFGVVTNVEETVGYDSLDHFGEYEDDSVFVRNDALKVDYEILLSLRKYSEMTNTNSFTVDK